MIPIGTRCIRIAKHAAWEECVVIAHRDPLRPAVGVYTGEPILGCDHYVQYACGRITAQPEKTLIPIGHDPDAETRNVEREVEA